MSHKSAESPSLEEELVANVRLYELQELVLELGMVLYMGKLNFRKSYLRTLK